MLTRAQKEKLVGEFHEKLKRASGVVLADYRGLDVPAVNELRARLRQEGGDRFEYHVAKNTLLRRAVAGSPAEPLLEHLRGPTAIAFSFDDPVRLAKVLAGYARDHEAFEVKAAVVEGRLLDRQQVAQLATLPTLEELRARLVGLIQAPAAQLARLLLEPGAQLARAIEARRQRLEEEGATS